MIAQAAPDLSPAKGKPFTWDNATVYFLVIDRFNNVYGAGVGGSLWGTLTRPTSRAWPETPYMLTLFLAWARPLLEAELATWS